MDGVQTFDQTLRVILSLIEGHKTHHSLKDTGAERIRVSLPSSCQHGQSFFVEVCAIGLVLLEGGADADDLPWGTVAVQTQLQAGAFGGVQEGDSFGVLAKQSRTQLCAGGQRCGNAGLPGKEDGFFLLRQPVEKLNALYAEIKDLFVSAGIEEFSQIPADMAERKKFADLFQSFNENLEAAKVQGFEWDKPIVIINEDADEKTELHADFDERTFKVLALRYKELFTPNPDGSENDPDDDVPYAVNSYLTTIDTADIDTDYMNSRFEKYLKIFYQEGAEAEAIHQAETELHKTFATLSQEEQKYANIFLHDIQSGAVVPQPGKTLREYIAEYIAQKQNDQIHKVAEVFGLDEKKLRAFMRANITEANINEFGRFDDLKATVDKAKAKAYFEAIEGTKLIPPKVPVKYDKLLREFIVSGGFDLKMPKES